jgi:hypothetical protein
MLKAAVEACGRSWKAVAPRVKGRTDAQCRERYMNLLNPEINKGPWTDEVRVVVWRLQTGLYSMCASGGPKAIAAASRRYELE